MWFALPRYSLHDALRPPGWISMARLPLAASFPWVVSRPFWALAILCAAAASDVLDGWCARRFHQESETGAALDAVMDKVFVLSVVLSLVAHGSLTLVEVLLLGTRDIGELGLAARAAARHQSPAQPLRANIAGKLATTLQFAAIVAVVLGTSNKSAWILAASVGGALAAVTYGMREARTASR